jgi:hypothetical protein
LGRMRFFVKNVSLWNWEKKKIKKYFHKNDKAVRIRFKPLPLSVWISFKGINVLPVVLKIERKESRQWQAWFCLYARTYWGVLLQHNIYYKIGKNK